MYAGLTTVPVPCPCKRQTRQGKGRSQLGARSRWPSGFLAVGEGMLMAAPTPTTFQATVAHAESCLGPRLLLPHGRHAQGPGGCHRAVSCSYAGAPCAE